jgi:hypothetical protein
LKSGTALHWGPGILPANSRLALETNGKV